MSKFTNMIAALEKIEADLTPEVEKASNCDSNLQEDLDLAKDLARRAAAALKAAQKRIRFVNDSARLIFENFAEEL